MNGYTALLQEENMALLRRNPLCEGLTDDEIASFIRYAAPEYIEMEPEQTISFAPGEKRKLGVVLEGDIRVFTIDYGGNRTVLNVQQERGSLGALQFMVDQYNLLYEITAEVPSKLFLADPAVLLNAEEHMVNIQHRILVNLMYTQRQLFLYVSEHLVCLSQRTIRDKVLRYLQNKSEQARAYEFDVPLSREDMAVYLAVDRASLSRTLGDLKREGVIDFHRKHFKILNTKHFHF